MNNGLEAIRIRETVVMIGGNASAPEIGDKIKVGKYTATCQKVTDEGALFLMDQYLDKIYPMNLEPTNEGGYPASYLRKETNKDLAGDSNFDEIRPYLVPVFVNDLFRIPTVGEMFGKDCFYEMDGAGRWPLMKNRRNRMTNRENEEYEWGWLQNKVARSATSFAFVDGYGGATYNAASHANYGVRPVFMVRL